jgi:ribosomal protein L10
MGAVQKKSKEQKMKDVERMEEYCRRFPLVAVVENPDLQNKVLKEMRENLSDSRILFVKKTTARALYRLPETPKGAFFFVFGTSESIGRLKAYEYADFISVGEKAPCKAILEPQAIKDKRLAELLPVVEKDHKKHLVEEYVVCEKDDVVHEQQVEILRRTEHRLAWRKLAIFNLNETGIIARKEK